MEKTYVDEAWVHWVHWVELHVRESRILNADSESGCISFLWKTITGRFDLINFDNGYVCKWTTRLRQRRIWGEEWQGQLWLINLVNTAFEKVSGTRIDSGPIPERISRVLAIWMNKNSIRPFSCITTPPGTGQVDDSTVSRCRIGIPLCLSHWGRCGRMRSSILQPVKFVHVGAW